MKTKSLLQFPFGTKVTSRKPPQREMAVIVRGRFHLRPGLPPGQPVPSIGWFLEQGPLTGEQFSESDDDRAGECLYPGDFADYKLGTEVMLRAACHAPGGQPVTECPVRFTVGTWSKTLHVIGRRVWTERILGAAISNPVPFVTMPLGFASAFGGPTHPWNPLGKGRGTPELPNVELPAARIQSKRDTPPPAGFGPINAAWPQRAGKMGKAYGPEWRKRRFPFYAEDFDWSFFHAAPADQQLGRFLRGDEEIAFQNLHRAAASFSARLPGLRMRAFVRSGEPGIQEATMSLDTLFADLDKEELTLTWRGLVPVREDDLADVKMLLLASEALADAPHPARHYHAILETFEADPTEKDAHLPPEAKAAMKAMLDADGKPKAPADAAAALLGDTLDGEPDEAKAAVAKSLDEIRGAPARLDAMKAQAANSNAPAPDPGAAATALAAQMDRALGALKSVRDRLVADGASPQKVAQADAFLAQPELKKLAQPPSQAEPGPGVDLTERDFTGRDFTGRDLSGANLSGARLLGAKLKGARLCGANLRKALLFDADLEEADLEGADLTQATVARANLRNANLTGAILSGALFDEADLSGATLQQARGDRVAFARAKLAGVHAQGVTLDEAISMEGDLIGADFRRARLTRCSFFKARAQGILLEGAFLYGSGFPQADVSRAEAAEIDGRRTVWRGARLDGADFRWARLEDAFFDEASALLARFGAADLKNASFYRAKLDGADLGKANLFGANLAKASVARTSFNGANLYSAKLLGTSGKDVTFEGANLKRAVLDPR